MLIYHNRMYKNSLHKQELLCSHHLLTSHFIFKPQLAKCYRVFIRFLSKRTSFLEKTASHLQQTIKTFTSFETHLPEKPSGCTVFFGKKWLPFVRRFFKLSKGFPLPKNGSPETSGGGGPGWSCWQAVGDLQCLGDEKKLHGFESVGSRLFLHELDTNKWGDKTTWCSPKQKWLVSSKKIPAERNPLSSRLG